MYSGSDAYLVMLKNRTALVTTDFSKSMLEINIRVARELLVCIDKEDEIIYSEYKAPRITTAL